MTDQPPARRQGIELALIVVLAALFVLTLHQSWAGWFEPIADTGRDLYIPEKIAQGEIKLYRDISYLYPPLAPHLIAAVVALFGSSFGVMIAIGIVTSGTIAILLYALAREAAGPTAAAALAFLFVTTHLAGVSGYSFNFIFPYSHNAVFGFLFILLFLYALVRHVSHDAGPAWLWIALGSGTLAGWSKIEYAAVFVIVLGTSFLIRRQRILPIAAIAGVNLALFAALGWYFSDAPPERHWLTRNILPESLLSGGVARQFYARIQGLDHPLMNLSLSAEGAILVILGIAVLAALDRWISRQDNGRLLGAALLIAALVGIQLALARHFLFFRGWFLLQLLLIPWAIRERKRTPLVLLLIFSLLLGSRVLLRLEPTWYGFLFAIPAEIVFVYVLFEDLPRRGVYRARIALLWLPLILLVGLSSFVNQYWVYESRRDNVVRTSRGAFHDRLRDRAEVFEELFAFLDRRKPESMVVIPEGLALNWLSRIPTSIPYHTFSPAEMPDREAEAAMIEAIGQNPPEIILLVRRDYGEFGYQGIGVDFGKELIAEIECLYEPTSYRESERFFVLVMERKPKRECP